MSRIAIACYRPNEGSEKELIELVRVHYPLLRSQDLVTDREPTLMKAGDGTILEVFEWIGVEEKDMAHSNKEVMALWNRFDEISESVPLLDLAEAKHKYANFQPL